MLKFVVMVIRYMSGFRYKWSFGKHCDAGIKETKKYFEFSLPKHLMMHDPIGKKLKSWEWTRINRHVFVLHPSVTMPSQITEEEYEEMRRILDMLL